MKIEQQIKKYTKISITELIFDVESFFTFDYPKILKFYSGDSTVKIFNEWERLQLLYDRVSAFIFRFNENKNLFKDYRFWDTILYVEELKTKLNTALNTAKWQKANFSGTYGGFAEKQYSLYQGQTIESVTEAAGFEQPDIDWIDVVRKNQIKEEQYTSQGNLSFSIRFDTRDTSTLESVIDVIDNRLKLLGRDLPTKIEFNSEDLVVLNEIQTLVQTVSILSLLKKGDNPARPLDGLSNGLLGGNRSSVQFPIIFRQIAQTFSTDDSFDEIIITGSELEQDAVFITFDVTTIAGQQKTFRIPIK